MTARRRVAPSERRVARRAKAPTRDADEEEDVDRARDAEATVREETGAEAEGTRTRALEARLVESETLRDGMRDALATLKEKYETMAMVMAGAVEARRGGFTSAEMKREVGLAKAAASEERARRMRAEADVEAAERRAREATAERNEARMVASARAASGSSAGVATTERVAALEEALAAAKREAKSLKQTCDRQKRELVKARARIASLETPIAGDAAGTPSRASPREDARAGARFDRHRLAGDRGLVHGGLSGDDLAVDGNLLARAHDHGLAEGGFTAAAPARSDAALTVPVRHHARQAAVL